MRHFIHEHLEHISVRMFDESRAELKDVLSQKPGVYGLYKKEQLVYVGKASDLFRRLVQHRRDRHAHKWDTFSAYVTRNNDMVHEVESLALRLAWPPSNQRSGRFGKSKNLRPDLRGAYRARQKKEELTLIGKRRKASASEPKTRRRTAKKSSSGGRRSKELVGLVSRSKTLLGWHNDKEYKAKLFPNGDILVGNTRCISPQQSVIAAIGLRRNGWKFWHFKNSEGEWCPLRDLK